MAGEQYERIECIHETEDTSVYLVRHRSLGDIRVQKVIRKTSGHGDSAYEARLLCGLRHSGIPILYDYGEDDESVCLTEEYIRGTSLGEYMSGRESIPLCEAIRYIIEIGDILDYLHTRRPYPILYRDLKPEHIILREGHPILIDYGIALLAEEGIIPGRAGTPGYSAPEQFNGGAIDARCDIYALGRIAGELLSHSDKRAGGRLRRLTARAVSDDPSERPATVREWCDEWRELSEAVSGQERLCERIAVIGTDRGAGATHIAISLCAALNHGGYAAVYADRSGGRGSLNILRNRSEYEEREGVIYHGDFRGAAEYGGCVASGELPEGILVVDCGTDVTEAGEADICLYVCSTRPWLDGRPDVELAAGARCYPIMNPPDTGAGIRLARGLGKRVYAFPYDRDPFIASRGKLRLFAGILRQEGIRLGAGGRRR